jgi:hypothetical protein
MENTLILLLIQAKYFFLEMYMYVFLTCWHFYEKICSVVDKKYLVKSNHVAQTIVIFYMGGKKTFFRRTLYARLHYVDVHLNYYFP